MIWFFVTFLPCVWLLCRWLESDVFGPEHEQLLARWPPISDDEFMDRCEPGTSREVALKVRRIISKQLGVPYEQVYPEHRLVEDLGAD